MEDGEEGWGPPVESLAIPSARPIVRQHIKKRALRNKALSVGFNDKDLSDYVGGFHKRKKKRRKEAQKQLEEKERKKRIAARKQRKLEQEFVLYGGVLPENGSTEIDKNVADIEEDETGKAPPVSGTKTYVNGDETITVTTVEISREDEDMVAKRIRHLPYSNTEPQKNPTSSQAKKVSLKKFTQKKSQKRRKKRDIQKEKRGIIQKEKHGSQKKNKKRNAR